MEGGRGGGGGGEEGRGERYSHESWSLSMGRVSLCYSTQLVCVWVIYMEMK